VPRRSLIHRANGRSRKVARLVLVTPFSEFPVDDFSLSDLFLDTKRLQQFNDFLVDFAVKEVLVGAGQSLPARFSAPYGRLLTRTDAKLSK
jgi:hypothetical protein